MSKFSSAFGYAAGVFLLAAGLSGSTACTPNPTAGQPVAETERAAVVQGDPKSVSPTDAVPIIKGGAQVLDVRTPGETAEGYLQGATLADILGSDFATKVAGLDKSKPVVTYCKAGRRAKRAAQLLETMGFSQVYFVMGGGYYQLKDAGLPTSH